MKAGLSLVQLAQEIERRAAGKRDVVVSSKDIVMQAGGDRLAIGGKYEPGINAIAHDQIATHTGIPAKYYDRMLAESPALLAANVNTWLHRDTTERMVRMLDGNARAFLSAKYRPLENEDLAEAILPVLMDMKLDIMSCQITDRRLYIKAVEPSVTRELTAIGGAFGDGGHKIVRCLAPALTISNSEVGMGTLQISGGVYDGFCSNLATFGERSLRKHHVGARHEIAAGEALYELLSDETRRKTDEAIWAQVRDVTRAAFERAKFDSLCDKIAETQTQKIEADDVVKVVTLTAKKFGMNETEGKSVLRHLIEGGDLTRFGVYNAITRAAQDDALDYDRATEFERIGAQIIELPKTEWRVLALAEAA